jgi:hypothetical protein
MALTGSSHRHRHAAENGQFVYAPRDGTGSPAEGGAASLLHPTDSRDHQGDATSRRVADALEAQGYRASVTVNYVAAAQNVASNTTIVSMFLMVSFVVVLIVLIGLMSTLVMNILDRTKEIGPGIGAQSGTRRVPSEGCSGVPGVVGLPLGYRVPVAVARWRSG